MARYRRFDDLVSGSGADAGDPTIESVRLRRAGLKSAMSGLEIAIAAPTPGRVDEWALGVRDALTVLQEVWTRHVVETEAPGAFLDELIETAPRLYNQAAKLREEHNEIMSVLVELDGMVPDPDDAAWAERMRGVLTNLCVALARHRQRGADLVFEAYAVDIGGG